MHQWDIPPVFYLGWITAIKSDLWISAGRRELAEQWLPRLHETYCSESPAAPPPCYQGLPVLIGLTYARLLWVRGDRAGCEAQLKALLADRQASGERLQELSILVYLAWLYFEDSRSAEAERMLGSALAAADNEGLVGPFLPLAEGAPAGLADALARRPASPLRDRLLGMLPRSPDNADALDSHKVKEPLSAREMEVLRCIAVGYSNQQISKALFISLHTVKSHARRINHKLGVARRTQAVAQAKSLGLLA